MKFAQIDFPGGDAPTTDRNCRGFKAAAIGAFNREAILLGFRPGNNHHRDREMAANGHRRHCVARAVVHVQLALSTAIVTMRFWHASGDAYDQIAPECCASGLQ